MARAVRDAKSAVGDVEAVLRGILLAVLAVVDVVVAIIAKIIAAIQAFVNGTDETKPQISAQISANIKKVGDSVVPPVSNALKITADSSIDAKAASENGAPAFIAVTAKVDDLLVLVNTDAAAAVVFDALIAVASAVLGLVEAVEAVARAVLAGGDVSLAVAEAVAALVFAVIVLVEFALKVIAAAAFIIAAVTGVPAVNALLFILSLVLDTAVALFGEITAAIKLGVRAGLIAVVSIIGNALTTLRIAVIANISLIGN